MKSTILSKRPPKIIHSMRRPENYRQLTHDAANNVHLRKQATALLECYACHTNGFRPAAKLIERETGIARQDISKVRKRLVTHGLIAYHDPPGFIFIDWERIRVFASKMKPLQLQQFKQYSFRL